MRMNMPSWQTAVAIFYVGGVDYILLLVLQTSSLYARPNQAAALVISIFFSTDYKKIHTVQFITLQVIDKTKQLIFNAQ